MDYEAFLLELKAADLSGFAFARLLKLNPKSISNYKRKGQVPSHLAVIATLLRTLKEHDIDYRAVFARIPIEPNAARGRRFPFDTKDK